MDVGRPLARFARERAFDDLPPEVQTAAVRNAVNMVGCMLGGARHDATEHTLRALTAAGTASGPSRLLGRPEKLPPLEAALVNGQASAAHAYDDTHLETVLHPAGPIAAALLAEAERRTVSGKDFLAALTIGVEVACRIARMLAAPPAEAEFSWYMTGVAVPFGAAAAAGPLLGLDNDQMLHALGLAASAAGEVRNNLGSMCTSLIPGQAGRHGYWAAIAASEGVTAAPTVFEAANGFAAVYAKKPAPENAVDGLGERWEILNNMAKPYPSGIVTHPVIDACLEIAAAPGFNAAKIRSIDIDVSPVCLKLTDRPDPPTAQLAQVSTQHWAAVSLVRRAAGIPEGTQDAVDDKAVRAARSKITATADDAMTPDQARVRVATTDGVVYESFIEHATGSLERPMDDAALDAKFLGQAQLVVSEDASTALLSDCRALAGAGDMRDLIAAAR